MRRALDAPGGALDVHVFEPARRRATGGLLVVPGLHPRGPDDPRLDRFCRVLADSGLLVVAPFVRTHLALEVAPAAAEDVAVALRLLADLTRARGLPRPAALSISFGSLPMLEVAARPLEGGLVGGLIVFGGYVDFGATIRFAATGRAYDCGVPLALPHDPLNAPALFVNLAPYLDVEGPRGPLVAAWHEMACRTWGKPELRPPERRVPLADELARTLPPSQRALFFVGAGLAPGAEACLDLALARAGERFGFADPRPSLARLRAPLLIAHGRDDDVIPWVEAPKLAAACPPGLPVAVALSGMFGHTGAAFPGPRSLVAELGSLRALMLGLVDAPHERLA